MEPFLRNVGGVSRSSMKFIRQKPPANASGQLSNNLLLKIVAVLVIISLIFLGNAPIHAQASASMSSPPTGLATADSTPAAQYVDSGNFSLVLGNVSTSYNSHILVPVMLYNYRYQDFDGLCQVFSFNPAYLRFNGVVNDVASQDITFSIERPSPGILRVYGNGSFASAFNPAILYYLNFSAVAKRDLSTSVLLDYSKLGNRTYPFQSASWITLVRGWTNLGPSNIDGYEAGTVPAVGYSPYNLSVLYVVSGRGGPWQGNLYQGESVSGFGGVYRSTDGGRTWLPVDNGLSSTSVNSIVVDPNDTNVAVISTGGIASIVGGAIFKTVNGGESWQETYPTGGNYLTYYDGYLYAASYHAILRSPDFGTTWQTVSNFSGIVTTTLVENSGRRIFVGLYQYGGVQILVSNDYGKSYEVVGNFPGYFTVSQILVDPDNESQMWALIAHGYTNYPNLFRSFNGGLTWSAVNDSQVGIKYATFYGKGFQNGYVAEVPQAIAIDPSNGSVIYVTGPGYFYVSRDDGYHFASYTPNGAPGFELYTGIAGQDNRMISVDPLNGDIIFKGSDQGLAISYDGGKTWNPLNNRSASLIYTVAADGGNIFTVAQDFAPIFSNDSGRTWYTAPGSEEGWASVDPYNDSIVLVESSDYFEVSNNGGKSFFVPRISNYSAWGYTSKNVACFAYSPNGTIFASQMGGVFRSDDYGKSWVLIQGSPEGLFSLAMDPLNMDVLYGSNFYHLYRSDDFGKSWTAINDMSFNSIAVDPANGSIVVGVRYFQDYKAVPMISYNGGLNFTEMQGAQVSFIGAVHRGIINGTFVPSMFPNFSSIDFFGASPQVFFFNTSSGPVLFYTTDEGLYETTNLGKTWRSDSFNIPAPVISDMFVSSNGTAYVSTYGMGVWADPELLSMNISGSRPFLTYFLPVGDNLSVDGSPLGGNGYAGSSLLPGPNNLTLYSGANKYSFTLYAANGGVYFVNFSENEAVLKIRAEGVQEGRAWYMGVGEKFYRFTGPCAEILLPLGNVSYRVFDFASDYAYYVPSRPEGSIDLTFAGGELDLEFTGYVYYNSSELNENGLIWGDTVSSNGIYAIAAGAGLAVLNLGTMQEISGPQMNFTTRCSEPYGNGFLLGGSTGSGAVLYFYDPQNNSLIDLSGLLPGSWTNFSGASLTSVQVTDGGIFLIGSGPGRALFGELSGGKFYNLTGYLTDSFSSMPWASYYSEIYVPKWNSIVVEGDGYQSALGVLNLTTMTFDDLSQELPTGVELGTPYSSYYPSGESMATDGSSVLILGQNATSEPYVGLLTFQGDLDLKDISDLFPSDSTPLRASWNGEEYVISGMNTSSSTPPVFLLNPSLMVINEIPDTSLYGTGLVAGVDSLNGSKFLLETFIEVQHGSYGVIYSKWIMFDTEPLSALYLSSYVNGSIYLNGVALQLYRDHYYQPLLPGNYTLKVIANNYTIYEHSFSAEPFSTVSMTIEPANLTLYTVTFTETGLPSGTPWSVTFNGVTRSSTANSITVKDVLPGNYAWNASSIIAVGSGTRYAAQTSSGTVSVPTESSVSLYYAKQYSVTVQSTAGGSASPSGTFWCNAGSTFNVTAIPTSGYKFAGWETNSSIKFTNSSSVTTNAIVDSPGIIVASFKAVPSSTQPLRAIEYAAVAVVVVVVMLVAVLLIRRR